MSEFAKTVRPSIWNLQFGHDPLTLLTVPDTSIARTGTGGPGGGWRRRGGVGGGGVGGGGVGPAPAGRAAVASAGRRVAPAAVASAWSGGPVAKVREVPVQPVLTGAASS